MANFRTQVWILANIVLILVGLVSVVHGQPETLHNRMEQTVTYDSSAGLLPSVRGQPETAVYRVSDATSRDSSRVNDMTINDYLHVGIEYQVEGWGNIGGIKNGMAWMDNLDLTVSYDTEPHLGIDKGRFFLYMMGNQGGSISSFAGDIQGISEIEAINSFRFFEAFYEQRISAFQTSLLMGIYDVNSEFDLIPAGDFFINSSHGIGAGYGLSGINGPSTFPYTSLAFRFKSVLAPGITVKGAFADGVPAKKGNLRGTTVNLRKDEGALLAFEITAYGTQSNGGGDYADYQARSGLLDRDAELENGVKVALGGWYYTKERLDIGWPFNARSPAYAHEKGVYGLINLPIYEESAENPVSEQGLSAFLRLGITNESVSRFSGYVGTGAVYTGFFKGRDRDKIGVALAVPLIGNGYKRRLNREFLFDNKQPASSEMNIEASYRLHLKEFLEFQLDGQYIISPGMLRNRPNALVVGGRVALSL